MKPSIKTGLSFSLGEDWQAILIAALIIVLSAAGVLGPAGLKIGF